MKGKNIPKELFYSNEHEWICLPSNDDIITVGITDFAQNQLGDIVYVDIDESIINTVIDKDSPFGTIEAIKIVSDLFMPITGEIIEINTSLNDNPDIVNSEPYSGGWLIKIKPSSYHDDVNSLMNSDDYHNYIFAENM